MIDSESHAAAARTHELSDRRLDYFQGWTRFPQCLMAQAGIQANLTGYGCTTCTSTSDLCRLNCLFPRYKVRIE